MSSGLGALCFLLMLTGAVGFGTELDAEFIFDFISPISTANSLRHEDITERAIFDTTLQVCHDVAVAEGRDFTFPPQPFTAESVAAACRAPKSSKRFRQAIKLIQKTNQQVDSSHVSDPEYHFDNEMFTSGRAIITRGLEIVKASNREMNYEAARERLGEICHTLQDFYSHSNWVEIGNVDPNANLIRPGTSIGNIADENTATCRNCVGDDCTNNILDDILQRSILTSGYFSHYMFKPAGKCSHGGQFDKTKEIEPIGGINKDKLDSEHGHFHLIAADTATAATSQLLEDIRGAAGDKQFLQMMGITGKALCFVIDTTGSMGDDIAAVRTVTSEIVDSKVGTSDEPSVYILVPFNDPDFGPLIRTTDPNIFKDEINSLTASGGGDTPELSLSGLQLALTGAPPYSEIFVFTDAPAKDTYLKGTVKALIEQTKSVVNFMITDVLGTRRRRQSGDQRRLSRLALSQTQLYKDLAEASGGQAIEVSKSDLLEATSIITESTSASLVTLLQAARSAGEAETFTFTVDESVRNLTVYITGSSVTFTLISPSGVSQESTDTTGSLITASQLVGNFKTLKLKTEMGQWEIKTMSRNPYTLKIIGESPIDFLFDFLEVSQGLFGGFEVADNRPRAGVNGSLLLTITGSSSATVTEVTLVESSGSGRVNGTVNALRGGDFLVQFKTIPSDEFVVLVQGRNNDGSSRSPTIFQRQSSLSVRASAVTVTVADSNPALAPGATLSVPFSVRTSGAGGTFTIRATNDRGFPSTFPSSLVLGTGGSANGTVDITAPLNTASGTDITLTIEAEAPGGADSNYVVQRLTVLVPVTDFTAPVCELPSLQSNCSENCSMSTWSLSVQVTDGVNGTGINQISLRQGDGNLNTTLADGDKDITLVSYIASCCSPDVELVIVDAVGNVGTCFYSVRPPTTPRPTTTTPVTTTPMTTTTTPVTTTPVTTTPVTTTTTPVTTTRTTRPAPVATTSTSTKTVQSFLLCLGITILGLNLPSEMGIS